MAKLGGRGLRRSRARWLRSLLWVADNSRCFFTFRTGWMNLITFYIEVLRYKFWVWQIRKKYNKTHLKCD